MGLVQVVPPASSKMAPFRIKCLGSMTMVQSRDNASVNFNQSWSSYESGFGNLESNHWLGLAKLHYLTNQRRFRMRVVLMKQPSIYHVEYESVTVDGESDGYRLHLANMTATSNAGDCMGGVNVTGSLGSQGMKFSTYDRDNDMLPGDSCARIYGGGWWYNNCTTSNLNGFFNSTDHCVKGRNCLYCGTMGTAVTPRVPMAVTNIMIYYK